MSEDEKFPSHLYWDISHMMVGEYVELVRELMRVRLGPEVPENTPLIDAAADELEALADAAEEHLDALGTNYDSARETFEVAFEARTDKLTSMTEGCIGAWTLFADPVVREVVNKDKQRKRARGIELDEDDEQQKREEQNQRGLRARGVYNGIFGEDGQDYYRLTYAERFRTLSALLRTLSREDTEIDFGEFFQPAMANALPGLSVRYEAELAGHLAGRDDSHGLAEHRATLRLALARYVHVLREAADRWSKESCERINAGLQPLPDRCQRLNRRH